MLDNGYALYVSSVAAVDLTAETHDAAAVADIPDGKSLFPSIRRRKGLLTAPPLSFLAARFRRTADGDGRRHYVQLRSCSRRYAGAVPPRLSTYQESTLALHFADCVATVTDYEPVELETHIMPRLAVEASVSQPRAPWGSLFEWLSS